MSATCSSRDGGRDLQRSERVVLRSKRRSMVRGYRFFALRTVTSAWLSASPGTDWSSCTGPDRPQRPRCSRCTRHPFGSPHLSTANIPSRGRKAISSARLPVVGVHDGSRFEDRVERGQALLAVDDQSVTAAWPFVAVPIGPGSTVGVVPEEQVADGKAAVHRVEEVAHLGRRPDERPLDVRQTNVALIDVGEQVLRACSRPA